MSKSNRRHLVFLFVFMGFCLSISSLINAEQLTLGPAELDAGFLLIVTGPEGMCSEQLFKPGSTPVFTTVDQEGKPYPDGIYTYELRERPVIDPDVHELLIKAREAGDFLAIEKLQKEHNLPGSASIRSGAFTIKSGSVLDERTPEMVTKDALHYDDVIITGSLCVGFDCVNGESFGYCTIKLKENNLQLCFEDTSVGSFPTNDWKIQINDTTSGGASYFTLWDVDGGRRPFTIEAGAPAHSLYVEDYGRVGLGTSIPYVELHIVDGDSPTIRLDQDGSSGWAAQRWDLCGNETNFFIRDVTNGSKLCFRIQPNTPSNTLCMRSTGYVGIGTWSPSSILHIQDAGPVKLTLDNTNQGDQGEWAFNSSADGTFRISDTDASANVEMELDGDGNLEISGDLTAAGSTFPDYVFEPGYELMSLSELADFVTEKRHLPNIPTVEDVDGGKRINMTQLQIRMLEKIEELTLHTIAQQKLINDLQRRMAEAESR